METTTSTREANFAEMNCVRVQGRLRMLSEITSDSRDTDPAPSTMITMLQTSRNPSNVVASTVDAGTALPGARSSAWVSVTNSARLSAISQPRSTQDLQ